MEWLENLKTGDSVVLVDRKIEAVKKVSGITLDMARVFVGGLCFRRSDGIYIGRYDNKEFPETRIAELTPEKKAQFKTARRRLKLADKFQNMTYRDWDALSIEQLEAIAAIVDAPLSAEETQ